MVPERGQSLVEASRGAHVIYAIGVTSDFRSRPFDTIEAHVNLPSTILKETAFSSFLYLSSTRVYGANTDTSESANLSCCPLDNSDLYNISKLAGEAVCFASHADNVRIARLSNVVGPHVAETESFIGQLCRSALSGHIQLRTSLQSVKDYISLDDVSRLLCEIALRGSQKIYNVASGIQLSHGQWASAIASETGCTVAEDEDAPVSNFPPINVERIREEFDFYPKPPLENISQLLAPSAYSIK